MRKRSSTLNLKSPSPQQRQRMRMSVDDGKRIEIHEHYNEVRTLGRGTYSRVYLAQRIGFPKEQVAIKHLLANSHRNFAEYEREVKKEIFILRKLSQNLHVLKMLQLGESRRNKGEYFLVMELCRFPLDKLLANNVASWWPVDQVKRYFLQLVDGLAFCHSQEVIHRDLKPANILVGVDNHLKIADFGMACIPKQERNALSFSVCTLWYRAPELLLAAPKYDFAVDVWSLGCTFLEMVLRAPVLPGESEDKQLKLIWSAFGTPNTKHNSWPGVLQCAKWKQHQPRQPIERETYKRFYTNSKSQGRRFFADLKFIDLIDSMMRFDPARRVTARDLKSHMYFTSDPKPMAQDLLPKYLYIGN